jgi:LmbE family N-acetylglucosaminyl deacetylase
MTDRAVLACYAHPDDEQGVSGTLYKYVTSGIRTAILCATRGEVGEIADPALATPETLGAVREQELRRAAAVIAVNELFFLDYRDSGMVNTAPNADPRAFINANEHEAIGQIVKVIRSFKPTLVFTFDETGGYGHPDHLAICKWTTAAFRLAGDPAAYPEMGTPYAPSRLFYASIPRGMIHMMGEFLREIGVTSVFNGTNMENMGIADERVTNRVDVSALMNLKRRSLAEHKTQNNPNSPFAKIPEERWAQWRGVESYALVDGVPLPKDADPADLFAGLPE